MERPKGRFARPCSIRPYRNIFFILMEGKETEPQYFRFLRKKYETIVIRPLSHRTQNHPLQILERARKLIENENLKKNDHVCIVVDIDNNKKEDIQTLIDWSREDARFILAISNPNFEFWLLHHFDKGDGISSKRECYERLQRYWSDYKKTNLNEKILLRIDEAVNNAKARHSQCQDWYMDSHTTVYRLIEKIQAIASRES